MLKDFNRIARRTEGLAADAAGAVALMVILFTGLHLPLFL
jgi:hypothetical protein